MIQIGLVSNPLKIYQKIFKEKNKTHYMLNALLINHIQLEINVYLVLIHNTLIMIQKNVLIAIMDLFFQKTFIIVHIKQIIIKQIPKRLLT